MLMSIHQASVISDHTLAGEGTREVVRSRFGEIVIDTRKSLYFTKGMLGMPHLQRYVLASLPNPKMQQFKLLQCLDDLSLSFIALPLPLDNAIIRREDAEAACREIGIAPDDLVLLLVVCVHRAAEATRLSVNARAPVFIDAQRKTGAQYVFTQDIYKVQHFIN